MSLNITTLPIFSYLDEIISILRNNQMLLLQASPGAGKTTLVPWKMLSEPTITGKILLLQPRRIAARATAERIAFLLGEKLGQTVGIRTKLETIVSEQTRLEVITEGVLIRIIQNSQSLDGYSAVIFDEFHERSLQGDCGLAFVWECREILRPDLTVLIMSATLPEDDIRSVYGEIPFISIPGNSFPVEIIYKPPGKFETVWAGVSRLVKDAVAGGDGDILVFLPGLSEIKKVQGLISYLSDCEILILHGSLPPEQQRKVFQSGNRRRIIISTNIAETSITIPGITIVIDSGLERRVRFNPRTGMDHWDTAQISAASAEQRKGRAGRLAAGACYRWWSQSLALIPYASPEIMEADLAPMVLETALWGAASPFDLKWLTPPPAGALRNAVSLLIDLGLLDSDEKITDLGRKGLTLGLHPRIGRMIIESQKRGWEATAALVAGILEEGSSIKNDEPDFRERIKFFSGWLNGTPDTSAPLSDRVGIKQEAQRILRIIKSSKKIDFASIDQELAGVLLLLAYPDRAARKAPSERLQTRWVLATGRAAFSHGDFSGTEFIAVADMDGGETDGRIFLAAPVNRSDLENGLAGVVQESILIEWKAWSPVAYSEQRVGRLVLKKTRCSLIPEAKIQQEVIARINIEGIQSLPWSDSNRKFLARCRFIEKHLADFPSFSDEVLADQILTWLIPFAHWHGGAVFDADNLQKALDYHLGWELKNRLEELAPEKIILPSGTHRYLDYSSDIPVVEARLQEFFGCNDTPLICGQPVMLHFLSPAGRPVQITQDLKGFWERAYPAIKKELMGRYPRHYWPDNPLEAIPTNRVKPRK